MGDADKRYDAECTWDNRQNTVAIFTQSQNDSCNTVESTLNIICEENSVEGVHALFCSLANDKTVSALVTVTGCKTLLR